MTSKLKLAWTSRSQNLFENNLFVFYIKPGQISVKRFFQKIILAVLSENTVQCPKTFFFILFVIYLHFSNCKFLIFCSMDWFRFQKPIAIGPFRIPRYQDFGDKSLVWFLGFQSNRFQGILSFNVFCMLRFTSPQKFELQMCEFLQTINVCTALRNQKKWKIFRFSKDVKQI